MSAHRVTVTDHRVADHQGARLVWSGAASRAEAVEAAENMAGGFADAVGGDVAEDADGFFTVVMLGGVEVARYAVA